MTGQNIITPTALVQTQNGKYFIVNSGEVGVDDNLTTLINIPNIGERDIKINFNCGSKDTGGDDISINVLSNSITIFEDWIGQRPANNPDAINGPYHFKLLLMANTSLLITLYNHSSTTLRDWFITGDGEFLSIE